MCYNFRRAGKRPFGLSPFGLLGMECPALSYAQRTMKTVIDSYERLITMVRDQDKRKS
jgi:hypothetical protein